MLHSLDVSGSNSDRGTNCLDSGFLQSRTVVEENLKAGYILYLTYIILGRAVFHLTQYNHCNQ